MANFLKRAAWLGCVLGMVAVESSAWAAATASLKAVKKNGVAITPTNNLTGVVPGDTITAEVFVSGWRNPLFDAGAGDTGLVRTFQIQVLGRAGAVGISGSGQGLITPDGWSAPLDRDQPPCDDPLYQNINPAYGCVGPNFLPNSGLSLDAARNDFILFGFANQIAVANDNLNFKWGGTIFDSDGQPDGRCSGGSTPNLACINNAGCVGGTCVASMWYAGTYNLVARAGMCGTFRFDLNNDVGQTFIGNPLPFPTTKVPILESLTITGPTCVVPPGACCNQNNGTCQNNIQQTNCVGTGLRWGGPNSTCATINPPCVALGACCTDSQELCVTSVAQANCQGAGQRWGGGGSSCAGFNPPCGSGACCTEDLEVCQNNILRANCNIAGQRFGGPLSTCATLNPPCGAPPPTPMLVSSNPAHCTIDARVPFVGAPANRRGFSSIVLTFDRTAGATEDSAADYAVQQIPVGTPTTIQGVVIAGNTATITFAEPIQPTRWTCVRHLASNKRACLGYLPADADGNGTATPADILAIIDNLNGVRVPPLPVNLCDIDRSGACLPSDILGEIDLLNGASGFPVANGTTIGACPSMTGP